MQIRTGLQQFFNLNKSCYLVLNIAFICLCLPVGFPSVCHKWNNPWCYQNQKNSTNAHRNKTTSARHCKSSFVSCVQILNILLKQDALKPRCLSFCRCEVRPGVSAQAIFRGVYVVLLIIFSWTLYGSFFLPIELTRISSPCICITEVDRQTAFCSECLTRSHPGCNFSLF